MKSLADKTLKREVAIGILLFLGVLVFKASEESPVETLKVVIWPATMFVGAAFGMEWASKQTNLVGDGGK